MRNKWGYTTSSREHRSNHIRLHLVVRIKVRIEYVLSYPVFDDYPGHNKVGYKWDIDRIKIS